jgi:hypothetical protein
VPGRFQDSCSTSGARPQAQAQFAVTVLWHGRTHQNVTPFQYLMTAAGGWDFRKLGQQKPTLVAMHMIAGALERAATDVGRGIWTAAGAATAEYGRMCGGEYQGSRCDEF